MDQRPVSCSRDTQRPLTAQDLSSLSGVPDSFVVWDSWRMSGHQAVQQALRNRYFDSYHRPQELTRWGFPNQQKSDSTLAFARGAALMGSGIAITRLDLTASELRVAARRAKNVSAARRMLCLAMVLEGSDRTTAAQSCGMDRQTLRDWVHRYNAEGLRGLYDLKRPGPRPKLTADQMAELGRLVEAGPDPTDHGVVRWRRLDLRDELERRFGVTLHERSVGKLLAKLGYRRLSVRPRHPQTDEEAQETFKKLCCDSRRTVTKARQRQTYRNMV
jgi:transposase